MMGVYFSISSLLILLILSFMFFSKQRVKNSETTIYSKLLIVTLLGLFLEILTCIWYESGISVETTIYKLFSKLTSSYYAVWSALFLNYLLNICNYKENRNRIFNFIVAFIVLIILLLPINFIRVDDTIIPQGLSIYLTYGLCLLFLMFDIIICIKYMKKIVKSKFTPLYALIFLGGLVFVLGVFYPQLFLIGYVFSLIVIIMYFTIENPDVKMLQQMTLAKDLAEKANRAKSDFLSSMSHEIRTPLNAIVGLSEDIVSYKDQVPNEVALDATDIQNASQTLLEIVGNILDINKIESEKMEIINTPYNLKKEIVSLCKVTTSRIKEKPIEFKLDIAEDLPEELIGDRIHIKQVINNLLSNAIKYTEKGMITLGIKCINEKDICKLIISVKDTGKGIKAENINKLFTKFERLDVEMNSTTEGTGLGLAITKSLVEMMGGKINVQSQYGKGSIFVVYLPQKISNQKRENIDINELSNENKKDLSGKKILIVDDNKLNIKVAIKALQDFNFEIEECYDGIECIEKVKEKEYDLILMDIMMPNMSGERALAKLKENKEFKTPVIALTADAVSGAREKYIKEGFVDYISKPFNKEQVKEKIENIFIKKEEVNTPQKVTYVYDSRTKEEYIIKDGQRNDLDNQL